VVNDRILIDERAGGAYFWVTYLPKVLGGGSFYLTGLRDSDGELFNGKDTYRLRVPADTPADDFWSVIVYSMKTKGFVENVETVGLSSQRMERMKRNGDGSVDVYFAPTAPEGMESNWIPTGKDFFLLFRLYGPGKALFERTWTLDDVVKVQQDAPAGKGMPPRTGTDHSSSRLRSSARSTEDAQRREAPGAAHLQR
jgi:Protein of unknown function (DUF1214)